MKRVAALALLFLITLFAFGQGRSAKSSDVPAYNSGPPKKGVFVPPILPKDALWGAEFNFAYQSRAYELASRVPDVIYQQPCYCYCDRIGHNSLHSCFESTHGAGCAVCLKELYYSYQQTKRRSTPAQIRQGIVRGDWKSIDLDRTASIN